MQYRIKTPIMASDLPELLDLAFGGKTQDIVKTVIGNFTVDEQSNPVDASKLTVKEYMALVPQAMAALGFSDEKND
jgi:hypothetical protein